VTDDGDDMLLGPKWIDSARFNILAKPAADAGNLTTEDIRQMLRALLIDRFKIVTHKDDQPVNVYLLTAPKPKLKTSDGSNRSACRSAGAASGGPPAAALRTYNCQNMTMALFATTLQSIAPTYFDHPLVEATGLDGAYDFSLTFSARGVAEAPSRNVDGAGPSDPTGAISLFEALNRQLGLKLDLQKHSMSVTVIDQVAHMPTEN
jgi:uncharacterized protein (TIGR03435 family)